MGTSPPSTSQTRVIPARDAISWPMAWRVAFSPGLGAAGGLEGGIRRHRHPRDGAGSRPACQGKIVQGEGAAVEAAVIPLGVPVINQDPGGEGVPFLGQPVPRPLGVPVVDLDVDGVRLAVRRVGVGHCPFGADHVGGHRRPVPGQGGFRPPGPHRVLQAGRLETAGSAGRGGVFSTVPASNTNTSSRGKLCSISQPVYFTSP